MEEDCDPDSLREIGARRRMLFDSLRPNADTRIKKKNESRDSIIHISKPGQQTTSSSKRKSFQGGSAFTDEKNDPDNDDYYNLRSSRKKRKRASTKSAVSATVRPSATKCTTKYYNDVERHHDDKKNTNQNNNDPDDSDLSHGNVLQFDSDDSVKDKDYRPDEISLSSNSSCQSTRHDKIEAVKKMLFTPEKFQNKVPNETNESQDLITLVDLLGSEAPVPYREFPLPMFLNEPTNVTTETMAQSSNVTTEPMAQSSNVTTEPMAQSSNVTTEPMAQSSNVTTEPMAQSSSVTTGPMAQSSNVTTETIAQSSNVTTEPMAQYSNVTTEPMAQSSNVTTEPMAQSSNVTTEPIAQSSRVIRIDQENFELNSPENPKSPECPGSPGPSKNPRSKKRRRNKESWVRVRSKNARLKGSPYKSSVAKKKADIDGRRLKPPCSCRAKCTQKVSEHVRLLIFNSFWKESQSWDQRRQYVVSCTQKKIKGTIKTGSNIETDRRKFSYTYNLILDEKITKVCRTMFLNTLCIGEKFVTNSLAKTSESGLVAPDQRGKHTPGNKTPTPVIESVREHISSYPCYESHYTRNKTQRKYLGPELNLNMMYRQYVEMMKEKEVEPTMIAKEWLYRHVFNTQFNLSFKLPGVDTCDECDAFQRKLKDATTDDQKKEISVEKTAHIAVAQQRYDLKAADKEAARKSDGKKKTVMFDLQKCMPTPCLTNSKSFYLRKLWTLNLTIYDTTANEASNMVWSENISGRGGNEIASCIIRWAQENIQPETEEITFWSDNCAGQNRNTMVIMAFLWILQKFPNLKEINHKFLLKGHTHMEVDSIHSIIERKKKKLSTMEIAVPRDWAQFIRTCGGKRPMKVFEMAPNHFVNMTILHSKKGPFILRKKNTQGKQFQISKCVHIQLLKENPGNIRYKTEFSEEFSEVSFLRQGGPIIILPESLPMLRTSAKAISTAKYNDLMTLLQWVPQTYQTYYTSLVHSDDASDVPEVV